MLGFRAYGRSKMALPGCYAASFGCNWVTFSTCSLTSSASYRFVDDPRRGTSRPRQIAMASWISRRILHSMPSSMSTSKPVFTTKRPNIRLQLRLAIQGSEPTPSMLEAEDKSAMSEIDFDMLEKDLDGDALPERWGEELAEDVKLLTKFRSRYNLVQVLEISRLADSALAGSRVLLLDRPGNIQSVQFHFKALTDSYYDAFASLPPLLPEGPIGILGLGGGTAARLVHHFWPAIEMHGWELDAAVVGVGRRYFDMLDLEAGKPSALLNSGDPGEYGENSDYSTLVDQQGRLVVHIGDALGTDVIEGGFAGLIVDLFSEGKVISALQEPATWERLKQQLEPGGRIMVNCGGSCVEAENKKDGDVTMEETLAALMVAFPGEVSKRIFYPGDNCMAMTGPFPDLKTWKAQLPRCLKIGVSDWRPTS